MPVTLKNIGKKLKGFELKGLNFNVGDGEYFVLLGPSGSGKTKTIEMIAGLVKPDSGLISGVAGKNIGFIYQDYMLFPHMSVFENISFGLKVRKFQADIIKKAVTAAAEMFDIAHLLDKNATNLSGGEKQRVAIARATVISPDIYILDEPTSALDRNLKVKTESLFRDLHQNTKKIFIHVTHDFEIALALGDRIAIIFNGEIVQIGPPDEIFTSPASKEIADFLGYRNVLKGRIDNNIFRLNGVSIAVPEKEASLAYVAIRSDDIFLSEKKISSSARNSFYGVVERIVHKSSFVEIILDISFNLTVDITRKSLLEMGIKKGDKLWATFKVSSIKVFKH